MAELTEEEKIVIGVCTAVAGLILIGIIIFVCCIIYRRRRYGDRYYRGRREHHYKDRVIDDYGKDRIIYDDYGSHDRYYGGEVREIRKAPPMETIIIPREEPMPAPMPLPPPPPPAPRTRWEMYGGGYEMQQQPIIIPAAKPQRRRYREVVQEEAPIVIPVQDPHYRVQEAAEPDTIYLKYRDDPVQQVVSYDDQAVYSRGYTAGRELAYRDDQALLYAAPTYARVHKSRPVRRARSLTEVRQTGKREKFVGEWGHTIFQPFGMDYNERAAKQGRDPFLWQS